MIKEVEIKFNFNLIKPILTPNLTLNMVFSYYNSN